MAYEMLPGLWVGDKETNSSSGFYIEKNIDLSINCNFKNSNSQGYTKFQKFLTRVISLIHNNVTNLKNILVHSDNYNMALISLVAYMIKYAKITANCAIKLIKSKHPYAFSDGVYYVKYLIQFEKEQKEDF